MSETIKIINSDLKVSDNFTFKEYFDTVVSHTKLEFDIPISLIKGVQYLRDFYGFPIYVTSAYRPNDKFGQHRYGKAVDLVPVNFADRDTFFNTWEKECLNYKDSPLIQGMRYRGVKGFGIENNNCIHIDDREDSKCTSTDMYGKFIIFRWVADGTAYGKSTVIA